MEESLSRRMGLDLKFDFLDAGRDGGGGFTAEQLADFSDGEGAMFS